MLDKPAYGDPCNGCGQCCMAQLCPVATMALRFDPAELPCPALGKQGEQYRCGVMVEPRRWLPVRVAIHGAMAVGAAAAFINGAGFGCDGLHEGEEDRPELRRKMRAEMDAQPGKAHWAIKVLGIR